MGDVARVHPPALSGSLQSRAATVDDKEALASTIEPTRPPSPASRVIPADREAVRRALEAGVHRGPRRRSTRLGWLIGLVGLGVAFGVGSTGTPASGATAPRRPSASAADQGIRRTTLEVQGALRRDPALGGARAATLAIEVLWHGEDFDAANARTLAVQWLARTCSRDLIAAASGDDRGLTAALAPALKGAPEVSALALDWKRLELR